MKLLWHVSKRHLPWLAMHDNGALGKEKTGAFRGLSCYVRL